MGIRLKTEEQHPVREQLSWIKVSCHKFLESKYVLLEKGVDIEEFDQTTWQDFSDGED